MRLVLLCLMALAPALANAKDLEVGMPFTVAKKLLITQKWQPVNVHYGKKYQYIGIENKLIKKGFKELENCAIDKPYCIFNYKKADQCLRLVTFGERIKDMKVVEWKSTCPATENSTTPPNPLGMQGD